MKNSGNGYNFPMQNPIDMNAPSVQSAYRAALLARQNSHSPYSGFKVGAAIKLKGNDEIFPGCNVENASYGATICAERTALVQGIVRHGGAAELEFIVIVTGESRATVPCALCLQCLAEFAADECAIVLGNESGILKAFRLKDLLPHPFRAFTRSV
ncbi:MAG: cytidine deaminase [Bdellovibrionales bacterium]